MNASDTNSTGWTYDTSRPANEDRPYKAFIIWGVVFLIVVLFGYELTKQITVYAFLRLPIGSYIYTSEVFMDAVVRVTVVPTIFIPFVATLMCLVIANKFQKAAINKEHKNGSKWYSLPSLLFLIIFAIARWHYWERIIGTLPDPSISSSQVWIAVGLLSEFVGIIIALILGVFLAKLSCHLTKTHQEVAI